MVLARRFRDTPCERCGWRYEGFHVCFDAKRSVPGEGMVRKTETTSGSTTSRVSHHDVNRVLNRRRDEKIIQMYKEGLGLVRISKEFRIAYATAQKVIKRAAEQGLVTVRPKGYSAAHHRRASTDGVETQ